MASNPFPPGTEVEIVEFEGNTDFVGKCGIVDHISMSWITVELPGDNNFVNARRSQLRIRCKTCSEYFRSKVDLDNHLTNCVVADVHLTNGIKEETLISPTSLPISTDSLNVDPSYPLLNGFPSMQNSIIVYVDKATELQKSSLPTAAFMKEVSSCGL